MTTTCTTKHDGEFYELMRESGKSKDELLNELILNATVSALYEEINQESKEHGNDVEHLPSGACEDFGKAFETDEVLEKRYGKV